MLRSVEYIPSISGISDGTSAGEKFVPSNRSEPQWERISVSITAAQVKQAKPQVKPYKLTDGKGVELHARLIRVLHRNLTRLDRLRRRIALCFLSWRWVTPICKYLRQLAQYSVQFNRQAFSKRSSP